MTPRLDIERPVLGIDPGVTGGLAFFYLQVFDRVAAMDMPAVDGQVNAALLAELIRKHDPAMAYVEACGARPGQGVSSMFKFGMAFGEVIGVLGALEVPFRLVSATKWKRHFGLTKMKEESRRKAIELFPACASQFARKKDHGRAEAALIAVYGSLHLRLKRKAELEEASP